MKAKGQTQLNQPTRKKLSRILNFNDQPYIFYN